MYLSAINNNKRLHLNSKKKDFLGPSGLYSIYKKRVSSYNIILTIQL